MCQKPRWLRFTKCIFLQHARNCPRGNQEQKCLSIPCGKRGGRGGNPSWREYKFFLFLDRVPVLMDLGLASEVRGNTVHYFLGLAGMGSVGPWKCIYPGCVRCFGIKVWIYPWRVLLFISLLCDVLLRSEKSGEFSLRVDHFLTPDWAQNG